MRHTDPPVAACRNLPTIFESIHVIDHRIAVGYCLGDGDRPMCPMFTACRAATPPRSAWHDGTWAAVLFRNGRRVKVAQQKPRVLA
jgi:hypothetical protein